MNTPATPDAPRLHWLDDTGRDLYASLDSLVARGADAELDAHTRDDLACRMLAWQRGRCTAIDRVIRAFGGGRVITSFDDIPGVPTDVFRAARVSCFDAAYAERTFVTSGTTTDARGVHAFASLALYARASCVTARRWLLPRARYRFFLLAPPESRAPQSSLSYMLDRFAEHWDPAAGPSAWFLDGERLDVARLEATLRTACADETPVAILGATWAFVHALDLLPAESTFCLPPGSVIMPTGGFKGRSRVIDPETLFALICARFGTSRTQVIQEYGMTELTSQAYEAHSVANAVGRYHAPPWMFVRAVDPETLSPLPDGSVGLLRIVDLLNLGSSIAIQTSDLGRTAGRLFEVHGRAPGATPRGCARAIDFALGRD